MVCDIGHPSWITFLTSVPTTGSESVGQVIKQAPRHELIRTAASDI